MTTYTLTINAVKPLPENGPGGFLWDVFMAPRTVVTVEAANFTDLKAAAWTAAETFGFACSVSVNVTGRKPAGFDKTFGRKPLHYFFLPVHSHYQETADA